MSGRNTDTDREDLTKQQWLDWRYGAAKYWYDWNGIPETREEFINSRYYPKPSKPEEEGKSSEEYNPPTKSEKESSGDDATTCQKATGFLDEDFNMVNQVSWEDDIIWDAETIIEKSSTSKEDDACWISPSTGTEPTGINMLQKPFPRTALNMNQSKFESIFSTENQQLVYGNWEDEIIWDGYEISHKLYQPKLLTLDRNDFNIMLKVPTETETLPNPEDSKKCGQNSDPHSKKLKKVDTNSPLVEVKKDPYNISNDQYYLPNPDNKDPGLKFNVKIRHSTPVVELMPPFIPTELSGYALQDFHRPKLANVSIGLLAPLIKFQPILPLTSFIRKRANERKKIVAQKGTSHFFMDSILELSGKDGELILIENCEEHPPLLSQVGMCSVIKNYYLKTSSRNQDSTSSVRHPYGDFQQVSTSPFLGSLHPDETVPALENNLYRSPIFPHDVPKNDFLLIRNRVGWLVRTIDGLFVAGQQCPLYVVPKPRSAKAIEIQRALFNSAVYRKFCHMNETPKRLPVNVLKHSFPSLSSNLQQWLDPRLTIKVDKDKSFVALKSGHKLPDETELKEMVTPEQCCALYSNLAGQQRLKDAGYEETKGKTNDIPDGAEDDTTSDQDNLQTKLKIELDSAPWNTTSAYVDAINGKCLLEINGSADPTGCGEGFSYVRLKRSQSGKKEVFKPKRSLLGTDADLRLMTKKKAKNILINFGVSDTEITKLSRKETIDMLRKISVTAGGAEAGLSKFSRLKSKPAVQEFKENCQRIFELQNKTLASEDVLSTDEESDDDDENQMDNLEEMAKDIESLLDDSIANDEMDYKLEEMERIKLLEMMKNDRVVCVREAKIEEEDSAPAAAPPKRVLKITRTKKVKRGETNIISVSEVHNPRVIELYLFVKELIRNRTMKSKFQPDDDDDDYNPKGKKRRKV